MTDATVSAVQNEAESREELLRVDDLAVHFRVSSGLGRRQVIRAVDGVSFSVYERESLGIIGESGCGKSTTGRAIVQLNDPTEGRILYRGEDISAMSRRQRRELREDVQFVFQDPQSSLNPRMTVEEIVGEGLRAFGRWGSNGPATVADLLDRVGLPRTAAGRYPHEFSGGQRQRIGIARALALGPKLMVLDEPVSALDVSVQAQVLNLLADLQASEDLSYVMISHDLDVIRHVSDRLLVMYLGVIVESGPADAVLDNPAHPYTKALVSAIPPASPHEVRERIVLQGNLPSPADPPSGCRFRTRCWMATERCATETPQLREVADGREVACHYPLDISVGDREGAQV